TEDVLQALVDDQVPEGKDIEYKQLVPKTKPGARDEELDPKKESRLTGSRRIQDKQEERAAFAKSTAPKASGVSSVGIRGWVRIISTRRDLGLLRLSTGLYPCPN
ncbi:MAG: hypothetical protein M1358_16060, partial [Chloroflexi bacterium]|nr:hypothetical protein [Chloroflexota bacterium]